MLFAGSVARRLDTNSPGKATYPFCVDPVAVGYASDAEKEISSTRAEMWLPIWDRGCSLAELGQLFTEGRAQFGRRQARNAVEFAVALCSLGVNKGLTSFVRYAFVMRYGLSYFAAPLSRIAVHPRPLARLLQDPPLVDWVDRLRRACNDKDRTPARYQAALRGIDRTTFDFANRSEEGNDAKHLAWVLAAIGRAERTLANGLSFSQEKYIRPLSGLSAQWLTQANDGTPEFRLAASLAGIQRSDDVGPLRSFLEEVEVTNFVNWEPGSTAAVWSQQPLAANLAAVFRRRQLEANRTGISGVPLDSMAFARLDDVIAFLHGETDDDKLADLTWGLLGVEYTDEPREYLEPERDIPFEFGVPRLIVRDNSFVNRNGYWNIGESEANTVHDADVFHALGSGQANAITDSVTKAARRLKSGGLLVNGYRNRRHAGDRMDVVSTIDPTRLLAGMLFPLSNRDLTRIANSVLYPPESEE